tara:strand:+ start:505 stop:786 length:282 start_codon:yes stop_codon:yes gene_type:complete
VAAVEQVAADQLLTPITVDPVVAVQQVQLQEHLLQNLAAAVEPVGQTAAAVDLVAAEMEQIMLVTVVIVDRLTVAVAVAETGTPVVYQVVLEL